MEKLPVLFIGHGSPMNAIDDNEYSKKWKEIADQLPEPQAILCISAHWVTQGCFVTSMQHPRTIYDFYGFPPELYKVAYPAPGSPKLAEAIIDSIKSIKISSDTTWGLDHGAWSVLCRMYPNADIPIVQLSLNVDLTPAEHFELGKELRFLRNSGMLVIGSGNIVHNLGEINWGGTAFGWAVEFDALVKQKIENRNFTDLINYQALGNAAHRSIPTNEHYLPLLYVLAAAEQDDNVSFFTESITMGSISMRSMIFGNAY